MSVCLSIPTVASSKSCLDPEFLKAIPIMKTRSGMQVCAGAWVPWVHTFKASTCSCVSVLYYTHVLNMAPAPMICVGIHTHPRVPASLPCGGSSRRFLRLPSPLVLLTVLLCGPNPEQLPGARAGGVGVQQRRLRGPGVPAEPARRARRGGLHRRLLRSHPLHRGSARPAAPLPTVRPTVGRAAGRSSYLNTPRSLSVGVGGCDPRM